MMTSCQSSKLNTWEVLHCVSASQEANQLSTVDNAHESIESRSHQGLQDSAGKVTLSKPSTTNVSHAQRSLREPKYHQSHRHSPLITAAHQQHAYAKHIPPTHIRSSHQPRITRSRVRPASKSSRSSHSGPISLVQRTGHAAKRLSSNHPES